MIMVGGIKLDNLTLQEALGKIKSFLSDGRQHYIVLPYSEFVTEAARDEKFRDIVNRADLSLCDGRGLLLAAKISGYPLKEQVPGVILSRRIAENFGKVFLFGGKREVAEKTAAELGENIVGFIDGYGDFDKVVEKINDIKPEILLVALGMPGQEKWIAENLPRLPSVKVAAGVGGAFDFISGNARRAPQAMQKMCLEWLWRFAREPQRYKRIFRAIILFPLLIIKEKII